MVQNHYEPVCDEAALVRFLEIAQQFAGPLALEDAIAVFVDPYSQTVVSYIDGVDDSPLNADHAQLQTDLASLRQIFESVTPLGFETAITGAKYAIFGRRTTSGDTTDMACVFDFTTNNEVVVATGSAPMLSDRLLDMLTDLTSEVDAVIIPLAVHALRDSRQITMVHRTSYHCKDALELLGEDLADLIDCVCDIHADPEGDLRLATMSYFEADPETGETLRSVRSSRIVNHVAFLT